MNAQTTEQRNELPAVYAQAASAGFGSDRFKEQSPSRSTNPLLKKPRMTAKLLQEIKQQEFKSGYESGRHDGIGEGLRVRLGSEKRQGWVDMFAGAVLFVIVEHAVLKPVWHWLQPFLYR